MVQDVRKKSAARSKQTTRRWLRDTKATIVYRNVKEDHVRHFPELFRQALDHYNKTDPDASYEYAPAASPSPSAPKRVFDVKCKFSLKGQKGIEIKRGSKHAFNFTIDDKPYTAENLTNNPPHRQNWQSIDACSVPSSPEIGSTSTVELVVAHLTETASRSAKSFLKAMHDRPLLVEPSTEPDVDQPCIFSYGECWRKTLSRVDIHAAILRSDSKGTVYRTDDSHRPIRTDVEFLWSLALLQTAGGTKAFTQVPHFVENIPVKTLSKHSQVPGLLRNDINTAQEAEASANFGPTGCSVDLHIDFGMHVLSTVFDSCIKLWALYPPTPSNLDLLYEVSGREQKLEQLHGKLEGGVFAITTGGTTIHLPPGWLHATYNVEGGFLVGTAWENYQDLAVLLDLFLREADAHPEDAEYSMVIRICEKAIEHNVRPNGLLQTICPLWKAITKVDCTKKKQDRFPTSVWRKFEQQAGGKKAKCPGCNQAFSLHKPSVLTEV